MTSPSRIAVAGFGLIGKRHVETISRVRGAEIAGVVDADERAREAARGAGLRVFGSLEDCLQTQKPDGVILATPNTLHVEQARLCVEHGCPVLIEKPIATRASDAEGLVLQAARRGVPLLVGHHRRYNPLIQRARALIDDGEIGDIRAVQATCWFCKPDAYFAEAPWRLQAGAGPISVNLVHDIDLLRHLCGEVTGVHAVTRPARRGGDNEDLAAALLEFANGALGTVTVSDSIVAPWSWEMTSGENPVYPRTTESCYLLGGTQGALSLPDLKIWHHENKARDWWAPMAATSHDWDAADPLANQIAHFADVIRGETPPLVSGEEGLRTLKVIEAIQTSATRGTSIKLH